MKTKITTLVLILISTISYAQWSESSLEFTSPGTSYTRFQLAEHVWSGSHAILFNAYKSVSVNGSLLSTGNTKYANNVGSYGNGAGAIIFNANGGGMHFCVSPGSSGAGTDIDWQGTKMYIDRVGRVGIGTTSPAHLLEVNGTIRSKEIKVEASPWPDYVFNDEYELSSLEETASFIEKNHHLPGMPSAQKVEANGVNLGEMNRLLLQKVEELTLHIIEQNERIKKLENQ